MDETHIKVKGVWKYFYRAVKRLTRPMLNFKSFRPDINVLAGIELMHMIRKGQMISAEENQMSFAEQFYAPAG